MSYEEVAEQSARYAARIIELEHAVACRSAEKTWSVWAWIALGATAGFIAGVMVML